MHDREPGGLPPAHPAPGGQAQEGFSSAYILPTLARVATMRPLSVMCAA